MPFKSEKQRRWMWANKPQMARRWEEEQKRRKSSTTRHSPPLKHISRVNDRPETFSFGL